jgi:hypothetical protein
MKYTLFFQKIQAPPSDTFKTATEIGQLTYSTLSQTSGRSDLVWILFVGAARVIAKSHYFPNACRDAEVAQPRCECIHAPQIFH